MIYCLVFLFTILNCHYLLFLSYFFFLCLIPISSTFLRVFFFYVVQIFLHFLVGLFFSFSFFLFLFSFYFIFFFFLLFNPNLKINPEVASYFFTGGFWLLFTRLPTSLNFKIHKTFVLQGIHISSKYIHTSLIKRYASARCDTYFGIIY